MAFLRMWLAAGGGARDVELVEASTTIGRGKANVVVVLEDLRMSLRHAVIDRHADGYLLRDQASTNGSWVNCRRVNEILLADGDQIQLGDTVMVFVDQGQVGKASASVTEGDDTPSGLL